MSGSYDLQLVALSVIVAIVASYTALELGARVSQTHSRTSFSWLVGGAAAMGSGIWSMHFIGMLAFHLPIPVAYDAALTILSMAIAMLVSGLALYVVRRPALTTQNLSVGAALMGIGICAMHYTGMHAMQMSPPIDYEPVLFMASVLVAIAASLVALWIAYQLRQKGFGVAFAAKLGSAAIMGVAIAGMHYTGMAAAQFAPDSVCLAVDSTGGMKSDLLALTIGVTTIFILAITLGLSALDAHFVAHTAKLAISLQAANEQLRDLAMYDSLTGLPNRMLLEDRMRQAASNADRAKASFALMFIDLDRFKPVNDTFGHATGDALLKAVAQRLSRCVRKADTVARTGGDEFVVVLGQVRDSGDAALVGAKILDELSRPFFVQSNELNISGSVGVSIYPRDGADVATLKANADTAMYQAKRDGRNSVRFYATEMSTDTPSAG